MDNSPVFVRHTFSIPVLLYPYVFAAGAQQTNTRLFVVHSAALKFQQVITRERVGTMLRLSLITSHFGETNHK